jgi:hypothetical protein
MHTILEVCTRGHCAKNDLSMEVLQGLFCTRDTFLRSVPRVAGKEFSKQSEMITKYLAMRIIFKYHSSIRCRRANWKFMHKKQLHVWQRLLHRLLRVGRAVTRPRHKVIHIDERIGCYKYYGASARTSEAVVAKITIEHGTRLFCSSCS